MPFVTDTHPLVYFFSGKHARLSRDVLRIFHKAESGQELIFIPVLVFMEIDSLRRKERIALRDSNFISWVRAVLGYPGFITQEVTLEIVLEGTRQFVIKDPVDSLIVATARNLDLPLITRDERIIRSRAVEVFW